MSFMNWTKATLGDVVETQLGKMLNRSHQSGTSTIAYLRNVNVQWGRIDLTDVKSMDIYSDELTKFTAEPGDLLVCEGGEVGRSAIWHGPNPIGIQNAIHRLRSKGEVDLTFVRYYLEYLGSSGVLADLAAGVTIKHLTQEKLRKVPIAFPPLDEQRRIVATLEDHLSRLDKALGEVGAAGQRALAFKKSYLLSLTEGTSAELTASAQNWRSLRIGDLGQWRGGGTPSKRESAFWIGGDVPWLTAKDMKRFSISATEDYITKAGVQGSSASLLPAKAVVIVTRSGILEHTLPVAVSEVALTINQDLKALVCLPGIDPKWVGYSLIAQGQRILEKCRKAGTTVANINFQEFLNFELKVPPFEQQSALVQQIEDALGSLDSIISAKRHLDSQLSEMRRALLKHAFDGKLTGEVNNE